MAGCHVGREPQTFSKLEGGREGRSKEGRGEEEEVRDGGMARGKRGREGGREEEREGGREEERVSESGRETERGERKNTLLQILDKNNFCYYDQYL